MDDETIKLSDEVIISKIYLIRGQKVMLDRDLAELYNVETKVLKQAVKRNIERFPGDFMFVMNREELVNWRSQFVTSNSDKMGLRYLPFCFTEQGVTMLACILNSKRAVQLNIQIVRVFTKIRESIAANLVLKIEIEEIKKTLQEHDENIEEIISYLDELVNKQERYPARRRIGFQITGNSD